MAKVSEGSSSEEEKMEERRLRSWSRESSVPMSIDRGPWTLGIQRGRSTKGDKMPDEANRRTPGRECLGCHRERDGRRTGASKKIEAEDISEEVGCFDEGTQRGR